MTRPFNLIDVTVPLILELQKPNLLVSFDKSISLYGIWNASLHHRFQSLSVQADHIQYDPYRSFVIYYNRAQKALLWLVSFFFFSRLTSNLDHLHLQPLDRQFTRRHSAPRCHHRQHGIQCA